MTFFLDIVEDDGAIESMEVEKPKAIPPVKLAAPIATKTHLMVSQNQWGWEQLRDYVVSETERYHGRQHRNPAAEKKIFQGFVARWGDEAPKIAKYAFDRKKGVWKRAPITVNRFAKGSDQYFAKEIADILSG